MNDTANTDDSLLTRLRNDDETAIAEIHDHYWKPLFYSAYKVLQDKAASQDAVQEVFISLWEKRKKGHISSLRGYLYGAVYFQVLNTIRTINCNRRMTDRLAQASVRLVRHQPHLFNEQHEIYQKILASLPVDSREFFQLNRDEGLTYHQIASQKGISVKTVEKKVSQALKWVRLGFRESLILIGSALYF